MSKVKNKKAMTNVENLVLGKKLKDISIDVKKYSLINLITLITLNILLLAVMIYYITISNNALILTLAIITVISCVVWSIMSFIKSIIKIKYSIYQNAIIKDFDSSKTVGIYANLKRIKITQTLLDKMGKNKTHSLILYFSKGGARKICLFCINENIEELYKFLEKHKAEATLEYNVKI